MEALLLQVIQDIIFDNLLATSFPFHLPSTATSGHPLVLNYLRAQDSNFLMLDEFVLAYQCHSEAPLIAVLHVEIPYRPLNE